MKRAPDLRGLSDDHHQGLVLARRARRCGSAEKDFAVGDVWVEVRARFATELEPHFRVEESVLAPALERKGHARVVEKLRRDHAELRGFAAPAAGVTRDRLRRFGELLERHIRYEERELFPLAEQVLSPEALRAVGKAWQETQRPNRMA